MKFKYEYMTQGQLGQIFGVSSHKIGDWLIKAGLRTKDKKPSNEAHRGGYCDTAPSGTCGYHYVWHAERTVAALEAAGHAISISPNSHLLVPPQLRGPFGVRSNPAIGHEIVGEDGSVAVLVVGADNARLICRVLNLAHEKGVFERLLGSGPEETGRRAIEPTTAGKVNG